MLVLVVSDFDILNKKEHIYNRQKENVTHIREIDKSMKMRYEQLYEKIKITYKTFNFASMWSNKQ